MKRTRDTIVSRCYNLGLTKEQAEEMTTKYLQWIDYHEKVGGVFYTIDYFIHFSIEWEKACDDVKRGLRNKYDKKTKGKLCK